MQHSMKKWIGLTLAVVAVMTFAALAAAAPLGAAATPAHSAPAVATPAASPSWNTGNLCSSYTTKTLGGDLYITCVGDQSDANLWWNFSTPENTVIQVTEQGSGDCINLNFASFYNTILVTLQGSNYVCPEAGGVNIALNSEGDVFILVQEGSHYSVDTFIYSFTVNYNVVMEASYDNDTVYFIGVNDGLGTASQVCPYGTTNGLPPYNRIAVRSMVALGSYDSLYTVWVDESGGTVSPYTIAWTPIINGFGVYDTLGYQVTTTVPAGGCAYLS
jgi:hypothetical protein